MGEGGLAGVAVPGDGASSSSSTSTGDCARAERFVELLVADFTELVSLLSAPSRPDKAEALARGLSVLSSVELLLILLRIEDRMEREVLSLVSDFENEGYCCRPSGTRFDEEPLFRGVRVPSLLPFDCCWPIGRRRCVFGCCRTQARRIKVA